MAGVKGRSGGARPNTGGARPGAGRKPKKPATTFTDVLVAQGAESIPAEAKQPDVDKSAPSLPDDPLQFLIDVMMGRIDPSPAQLKAAIAATQYKHPKRGDGGKKDDIAEASKKAAAGKFGATATPPRLIHSR